MWVLKAYDRPHSLKSAVSEARPYGGCANEEDRPQPNQYQE
ncbi:MAG: hypothetical protein ABI180_15685 [Microcoleus sp.]